MHIEFYRCTFCQKSHKRSIWQTTPGSINRTPTVSVLPFKKKYSIILNCTRDLKPISILSKFYSDPTLIGFISVMADKIRNAPQNRYLYF